MEKYEGCVMKLYLETKTYERLEDIRSCLNGETICDTCERNCNDPDYTDVPFLDDNIYMCPTWRPHMIT